MLGISATSKVNKKNRNVIPDKVLIQIKDHLEKENKHFLLACYLLHYLFIRPREMTFLKIRDISLRNRTVALKGEYTKNGKDSVITIPKHVIELLLELNVFSCPPNFYLFSKGFRPGTRQLRDNRMARYWHKEVLERLKLNKTYKLYSLKDTGITNMIKAHTDLLSVRDQARHSSVSIRTSIHPVISKRLTNKL